jgi:oxygen-independent coproporphyrinogen-3 oxidase
VHLTDDDRLRRDVIQGLMCHDRLEFAPIEQRHGIVFNDYFAVELEALTALADDALIVIDAGGIDILDRGRLLLRPIAMVFDAYLKQRETPTRFSRVI